MRTFGSVLVVVVVMGVTYWRWARQYLADGLEALWYEAFEVLINP